jgi:AAHS family 4-hydroxybenzoate transporter-like MFS transporter
VLISDGFDLSVMGYVAPELAKVWHIAPHRLVGVLSAGIFGLLLGAPLLSLVGDRLGRKKAILIGLSIFGTVSLISMAATSLPQFVALRFLTGLGLGGVIPNTIALVAELVPKRLRGRLVIVATMGVAAGIALPGLVAAGLVPRFGWPVLLLAGGAIPLMVAVLAVFLLPQSNICHSARTVTRKCSRSPVCCGRALSSPVRRELRRPSASSRVDLPGLYSRRGLQ